MTEHMTAYCKNRQSVFNLKADLSLSEPKLQQLLKPSPATIEQLSTDIARLAQASLPNSLSAIEHLANQGTFHHIFSLDDSTGNSFIIKTNKAEFPIRSFNFYIDQWVMQYLQQSDLPSLKVYVANCERTQQRFDYLIMQKASGKALIHFKSTPDQYDHYVKRLGIYLAKIHSIHTQQFGLIDSPHLVTHQQLRGLKANWIEYVYLNLSEHLAYCFQQAIFTQTELNELTQFFADAKPFLNHQNPVLLHGDLNDHNIFIEADQLLLIDWEDALCGDPLFDIALWGTFVGHHEKLPLLLQGYQTITTLPQDYLFKYWAYYLRIMIAKTVVRYKFGYYRTDKIPAIERIRPAFIQAKQLLQEGSLCEYC